MIQNKRGISQAFSPARSDDILRRATVFDVFDMSQVLVRSISDLCGADHGGDKEAIARWCANKTPGALRDQMTAEGSEFWILLRTGQTAAVGALSDLDAAGGTGRITLNYVDPGFRGTGVSTAMLAGLEERLRALGASEGVLTSTATARAFYGRRGWQPAGPARRGRWILGYPMRKSLHP